MCISVFASEYGTMSHENLLLFYTHLSLLKAHWLWYSSVDPRLGVRDAPPPGLKFFHFHAVFGKNLKNNSNFGSWRTPLGKSWIHHWYLLKYGKNMWMMHLRSEWETQNHLYLVISFLETRNIYICYLLMSDPPIMVLQHKWLNCLTWLWPEGCVILEK